FSNWHLAFSASPTSARVILSERSPLLRPRVEGPLCHERTFICRSASAVGAKELSPALQRWESVEMNLSPVGAAHIRAKTGLIQHRPVIPTEDFGPSGGTCVLCRPYGARISYCILTQGLRPGLILFRPPPPHYAQQRRVMGTPAPGSLLR